MKLSNQQVGAGFISLIYNLAVVAIIAYVLFLLGPIYLENHAVKEAMKGLDTMKVVGRGDSLITAKNKIRNFMAESFRMNNVVHVPLENVSVTRSGSGFEVNARYEVQVHFLYNVDFNVDFDDQAFVTPK